MKIRLCLALLAVATACSGCAVGFAGRASGISTTGVTINGAVFSNTGGQTTYYARYGKTTAYGQETAHRTIAVNGHPELVSLPLTGLDPDSTYHYRLCATDTQQGAGPGCSGDGTLGTVGDTLSGVAVDGFTYQGGSIPNGIVGFDARSGPHGENPDGSESGTSRYGTTFTFSVTCLRVDGRQVTIGLAGSGFGEFEFFTVPDAGGSSQYFTEAFGKRSPADCPAQYTGPIPGPDDIQYFLDSNADHPLTVHDAP